MTDIKVGDKFFSTPTAHLSCDMSRDTVYEVTLADNYGIHWRDESVMLAGASQRNFWQHIPSACRM